MRFALFRYGCAGPSCSLGAAGPPFKVAFLLFRSEIGSTQFECVLSTGAQYASSLVVYDSGSSHLVFEVRIDFCHVTPRMDQCNNMVNTCPLSGACVNPHPHPKIGI